MHGLLLLLAFLLLTLESVIRTSGTQTPEATAAIEANFLSLLGISKRPRPDKRKAIIPAVMLEMYQRKTNMNLDTGALPLPGKHSRSANTVTTFTHTDSAIDSNFKRNGRFRLKFDVSSLPETERVTAAELRLTVDPNAVRDESSRYQRIQALEIMKPGVKGKFRPILRSIDSKVVDVKNINSVGLDILPAVERWRHSKEENHGIIVDIKSFSGKKIENSSIRLRRSVETNESEEDWRSSKPLLMVFSDDGKNSQRRIEDLLNRRKRAPSQRKHKRKDDRDICRRRSLYVDFADVGWNDWIVAPPGYEAYYCAGDCPFPLPDHLNSTNHAIVQTLVNSVNPNLAPKACCVPTTLQPISMLYLDEDSKVVLKTYTDMAVTGCGCR